tara:strand:+ start:1168 stop:1350 length:183 start_codon:yes stop_codon:yes gene_type:complete
MHLFFFALASSEWGVSRFVTDLCALSALAILVGLPVLLLKDQIKFRSLWTDGSAVSNRLG